MPTPEDQIRVLRQQAALFPSIAKGLRESGGSELNAIDLFAKAVHARTGVMPSNWEVVDALSETGTGFDRANKQRSSAADQAAILNKYRKGMQGQ
jgi:hypothetical protein